MLKTLDVRTSSLGLHVLFKMSNISIDALIDTDKLFTPIREDVYHHL